MKLTSDKRIAETSSKGNQEKWFEDGKWYKLDQFGYEALAETVISRLLEKCSFKWGFVRYSAERIMVHNRPRTASVSNSFLSQDQSIITLNRLISNELGKPLVKHLRSMTSDVKRLKYMAEKTMEITGLDAFGEYLTLLFEIDALFLNEDRHLNNIAVLYNGREYDYCPVFDNGAGLLSDVRSYGYDISAKGLYPLVKAQPLGISFTRQVSTMRRYFGRQLMVGFTMDDVNDCLQDVLLLYPERDRWLIKDRVMYCIGQGLKRVNRI